VDFASFAGVLLAAGGILGGLLLEGGRIQDVRQVTAALIVFGGTLGAVMLHTPPSTLVRALKCLPRVFYAVDRPRDTILDDIIGYATKARKMGLVSLETIADNIEDPFLSKALTLELDIALEERRAEADARVYESAGGYAPTIGIIGAVMGLIQVMKNLANIDEVGHGIAVAFVATVYGVASANLFFLPAAGKIKARAAHEAERKEMMLEGVCSIVEGLNPKIIRTKLEGYLGTKAKNRTLAPERQRAARGAAA
jgi:chemotaxis protein MotA